MIEFRKASAYMYIPINANLCFEYHCLDNFKMYKYAFVKNVPCSSRVMSIFTSRPRPAELMLGEVSSPFCIPVMGQY